MIVISGAKSSRSAALGPDQKIADEQRMPGIFGDDPHRQVLRTVGAADEVLHEQVATGGMGDEVGMERLECLRLHRAVVVPPDVRRRGVVADDELVLRRAAGVLAGVGDERAAGAQSSLAAQNRFAIKLGSPGDYSRPSRRWSGRSGRSRRHDFALSDSCIGGPLVVIDGCCPASRPGRRSRESPNASKPEKSNDIKSLIDLKILKFV